MGARGPGCDPGACGGSRGRIATLLHGRAVRRRRWPAKGGEYLLPRFGEGKVANGGVSGPSARWAAHLWCNLPVADAADGLHDLQQVPPICGRQVAHPSVQGTAARLRFDVLRLAAVAVAVEPAARLGVLRLRNFLPRILSNPCGREGVQPLLKEGVLGQQAAYEGDWNGGHGGARVRR